MRPFSLQDVKAGKSVVTRYGIPVTIITTEHGHYAHFVYGYFDDPDANPPLDDEYMYCSWTINGKYHPFDNIQSKYDLFMA